MPRPCKRRRICSAPACGRFAPEGAEGSGLPVKLTLDEYEAIRLIDYVGMTQEECAAQMRVARATVQAIYGSARAKLAACLVMHRPLEIGGGDVELCMKNEDCALCKGRSRERNGRNTSMKIATTYENGQIFQHFGHTEQFKIYEVADGKVVNAEVIDTNGSGHGALAGFLMRSGVNILICGGIGGGAQVALAEAGIKLYGGVSGDADAAVNALLADSLQYNPDVHCDHHDHEHGEGGHSCGDHGCGHHSCHE